MATGDRTVTAVETLRQRIAELTAEARALKRFKLNRAETLAAIERGLAERVTPLRKKLQDYAYQAAQEGVYWAPSLGERDFLPLVALAVGPAKLLKVLAGDLEDVDDGPCMADRGRRLAEIAAERRSLEIEEEKLIRVAEAGGQRVTRRPDADPSIVMAETLPWEAR